MVAQGSRPDSLTIALQPIHDADYHHVGDRLVYRQRTSAEDPVAETARALAAAIYELDDVQRPGDRELFITLPRGWLTRNDLLPMPARLVVIGLELDLDPDPELLAALVDIRERGYRLHAPLGLVRSHVRELMPLVDVLTLSSPRQLGEDEARKLRIHGKRLMAMDIRDQEQLDAYQRLGSHYFNGRYLAEPTFHASRPRGRHGNRAAQMRLVNELYRHDADIQRLYELILQMPHLHVAILRRANSSYYARGSSQTDLRQAMHLIGLHELRRLVMTLSLASELPSSKLTVRFALVRAFMCRNLAAPFRNIDPEDAFTTGLFSLMDALLDEEQSTLLDKVSLSPAVTRALTDRTGHLGAVLSLAEGHEKTVAELPEDEHPDQLQACYLKALAETDALMNRL